MGVIQLLFLIGHLYLLGVCIGEDQQMKRIMTHIEKDGLRLHILLITPHSIVLHDHEECISLKRSTNVHFS